jgi:RNA polymerase sigma-70 factor (ECF subfamily)
VGERASRRLTFDPLVARLRAGDEAAFRELVAQHGSALMRLALIYSPSRAVAEEVVQETWIAVLRAIDGFEGRASLRTWISRILVNAARRRAGLEGRSVPFSALGEDDGEPAVDPSRFRRTGAGAGHWLAWPADPSVLPEQRLLGAEVRERVQEAITRLRSPQREVFVLRDVEGWPAGEVSDLLEITPGNQRVLLHRARAKVRQALEDLL